MNAIKAVLDAFDPKAWYLAVSGVIFLAIWLWRRYAPNAWAAIVAKSPAFAQLPVLVLGALISAAPALGKPLWQVVQQTILGTVLAAVGANGLHAMLRVLPGPYDGAAGRVAEAVAERNADAVPVATPPAAK